MVLETKTRGILPDLAKARFHSYRRLKEMIPVLFDLESVKGLDPERIVYESHRDICDDDVQSLLRKHRLSYDITVMPPLVIGEEYVKTIGHDHTVHGNGWSPPEIFEILAGEGYFLLQRYDERRTVDVSLVTARAGDIVLVPPNCGHLMINASQSRLVTGNLIADTCMREYDPFIRRRGGAYYLLTGNRLVRNTRYPSLPGARLVRAGRDVIHDRMDLISGFCQNPERFDFLKIVWGSNASFPSVRFSAGK